MSTGGEGGRRGFLKVAGAGAAGCDLAEMRPRTGPPIDIGCPP